MSFDAEKYHKEVKEKYADTIKALDVLKKHKDELSKNYDEVIGIFIHEFAEVIALPFEDEVADITKQADEFGVNYCTMKIQQLISPYLPDYQEMAEKLESYYSW